MFERQLAERIVPPDTVLSERDPDVPAWDSLSVDAQRMYAREMEVYAGFIEQTDHHLGRVIDFIDELGELDNTIIVVMSDNGASAEGGVHGTFNEVLFFNGVPETLENNLEHFDALGRTRHVPALLVGLGLGGQHAVPALEARDLPRWRDRPVHRVLARGHRRTGEVRTQYAHVTDLMPTILDALGSRRPT